MDPSTKQQQIDENHDEMYQYKFWKLAGATLPFKSLHNLHAQAYVYTYVYYKHMLIVSSKQKYAILALKNATKRLMMLQFTIIPSVFNQYWCFLTGAYQDIGALYICILALHPTCSHCRTESYRTLYVGIYVVKTVIFIHN